MTRLGLKNFEFANKQLQIFQAMSGIEAREILAREPNMAVALIDVVMETDDAGLQLIDFIRNELKNSLIRLIIRTGQPGMAPEREVIEHYDIDDYKNKTELTAHKLYTTMRVALKSFRDLTVLDTNRKALRKILDAAPTFYHPQSLKQFFNGVLTQIINLCNLGENSLIATVSHGIVVTTNDITVQSGTGRFAKKDKDSEIEAIIKNCLACILDESSNELLPPGSLLIPLEYHKKTIGFVYLEDAHYLSKADQDMIHIMAHQCAFALENLRLYFDLQEANQKTLQMLAVAEQTRSDAESANRAKSTFLANMSHELRTPLNSILGHTQILGRDTNLKAIQEKSITNIEHSGNYLLTLINDILEISKIETGKIKLYPSDFRFKKFIEDIVKLFQNHAEQKGLSFIYKPLSHLPSVVHADEKRLRQILINLLGNAVKFTEKGGITLKIGLQETKNQEDHNPYIIQKCLFQIEDTGIGIAVEERDNIFLPFYQQQVGNKEYKEVEGSGLGLSITKTLVEMMEGTLHIESTLNQGSTFWTMLDLKVPKFSSEETEESVVTGYQGATRKILVIDDQKENRFLLINVLNYLGFETLEANDGQDGLEKVHLFHPDLIFTDLVMPIMDGFELVRQIRNGRKFKKLPVIITSAIAFNAKKQKKGLEVGYNDFLHKPFHIDKVLKILQKHLGLIWTYAINAPYDKRASQSSKNSTELKKDLATENDAKLVAPPAEQVDILLNLVMRGNISGILKEAAKIEKMDQQFVPFANNIRQLANEFKIKQLRELLNNISNDSAEI
jgi:signal transduction histidine kinase/DNA-binding NarL/FixJ family response regulator